MSQNYVINGVTYPFPDVDDQEWGQQVTDWANAVTNGMLQKAGGTFTLTADIDFGANYGVKSLYFKSRGATIAAAGVIRLASAEVIAWRDNGDTADLELTTDSSDRLTFNGNPILSATALTGSRAVVTDASGVLTAATTTATEIGYVNGVTSAIQTQLNAKAPAASPTFSGTITTPLTASRAVVTGASSELAASAATATEIGYLSGVSSAIQTQINAKAPTNAATATGAWTFDTNTLVIDSTNHRVGILNASPGYALDVTGAAKVSTAVYTPILARLVTDSSLGLSGGTSGDGGRLVLYGSTHATVANRAYIYGDTIILSNAGGTVQFGSISSAAGVVFNEGSVDIDFRIESDNNANMFFVDASADAIFLGGTAIGASVIQISAGGMVLGNATGGNKGGGTINAAADIYKNNSAYTNPDYVLEHYFKGKVVQFAGNEGASAYPGILPIGELKNYMEKNLDLPGVKERFRDKDGGQGIFARADIALEKLEEAHIYIAELHQRIAALEALTIV